MIVLKLDKVDFRTKPLLGRKKDFIMIKGPIQQKDKIIINVSAQYSFKMHESKRDRSKWRSGHIHTLRVGAVNASSSVIEITTSPSPLHSQQVAETEAGSGNRNCSFHSHDALGTLGT